MPSCLTLLLRGLSVPLLLAAVVTPLRAAEAPAVLTVLQGGASITIGHRVVAAVPGLRLPSGSIVETLATTALVRVEWPDGKRADFGADTRALLRPAAAGRALIYLLAGSAKISQDGEPSRVGAVLQAPAFELKPFQGVAVVELKPASTVLFAERGALTVLARRGGELLALKPGQALVASGGTLVPQARPPAGWAAGLPRAFRDTLPSQLSRYAQGPEPVAEARPAPSYAGLQAWLTAEAPLRREFPARFKPLLADAAFKEAVLRNLASHPEWEPLVRPPPPPRPSPAPAPALSRP